MRDFEEDVDDIGDGGFKDETIGHREGFWQPRNPRDFMYFDEVLRQKKRRIQKERWYQRERNKEISVMEELWHEDFVFTILFYLVF
jgi:hypothetical protein